MRPLEFVGGQTHLYILELDMARQGMANDWSFTAWGENGEVSVSIVGRGDTQHFPYIEKNDDLLPSTEGGLGGDGNNNGDDQTANNLIAATAADDAEEYATDAADYLAQINALIPQLEAVPIDDWSTQVEMHKQTCQDAHTAVTNEFIGAANSQVMEELEGHLQTA